MPSSTAASTVPPAIPKTETASSSPALADVDEDEDEIEIEPPTARVPVTVSDTAPRRGSGRWVALVGGLVVLAGLGIGGVLYMDSRGSTAPPSVAASSASPSAEQADPAAEADDVVQPPAEPEDSPAPEDPAEPEDSPEPAQQIIVPAAETAEESGKDAARRTVRDERPADAAAPEGGEPAEPKVDVAGLMQQAKQKRDAGQKSAAEALYQQVLARQPRHKEALSALGELAFGKGDSAAAVKYFGRAVKVSPKDADLRIQLGDALFKLERYEKARTEFAKAAASGHPSAIRRLQIVDAKLGK
jgi:hypothetical protein